MKNKILSSFIILSLGASLLTGCASGAESSAIDLNSLSLDQIIEKAKEEGRVDSVGNA